MSTSLGYVLPDSADAVYRVLERSRVPLATLKNTDHDDSNSIDSCLASSLGDMLGSETGNNISSSVLKLVGNMSAVGVYARKIVCILEA